MVILTKKSQSLFPSPGCIYLLIAIVSKEVMKKSRLFGIQADVYSPRARDIDGTLYSEAKYTSFTTSSRGNRMIETVSSEAFQRALEELN